MPNEPIIYLASTALWTRWMAIGMFISTGVILFTVITAWITLIGTNKKRQEDNNILLLKLWYDEKYSENLVMLVNNSEKLFPEEGEVKFEYEKESEIMLSLYKIIEFIYKLNYYLDKKIVTMENLSINFSGKFGITDETTAACLYQILKEYEDRYKPYYLRDIIYKFKEIRGEKLPKFAKDIIRLMNIDIFFMKIAKYQGNKNLINIIEITRNKYKEGFKKIIN